MELNQRMSEEQKAKISAALMGHPAWNKGIPQTDEQRAKESVAQRGHAVSLDARAKNGVAHWKGGRAVSKRKHNAKRRLFGFAPLNEPFVGCESHHVDADQVIHMPRALHCSFYHNQHTGRGMAQMNAIAYNFLFKQGIEAAIAAKE